MGKYDTIVVGVEILEHPDLLRLPADVQLLHVHALLWSKLHLTDGEIPRHMVGRIGVATDDPADAADALTEAGLWEATEDGWRVLCYLDTQMSADRTRTSREADKGRYDRWRAAEAHANAVGNGVANAVANESAPPRPAPQGKGGEDGGAGSARTPQAAAVAAPAHLSPSLATTLARLGLTEKEVEDGRCARCGVQLIWIEELPEGIDWPREMTMLGLTEETQESFCPFCAAYSRSHQSREEEGKETCLALTKPEQVPCSQQARPGSMWCRFHQQERSRGRDPGLGERRLVALREKARLVEVAE